MAATCTTVIAGVDEDPQFAGLCHIAESLSRALPNFHYRSIVKDASEWQHWLRQVCSLYGWVHFKSPLVWREIGISGRTINYIGGTWNFSELLHRYYNIDLHLNKEELEHLKSEWLYVVKTDEYIDQFEVEKQYRYITIVGAGRSLCSDLVPQLVTTQELWKSNGVMINLYDESGYFKLKKIVMDSEATGGGLRSVVIVDTMREALQNCEILIYLDTLLRDEFEEIESCLKRNYEAMVQLSADINSSALPHMKVILSSMGLSCFCTNALHTLVTKLPKTNIVSTSAQYGLEILHPFLNSMNFDPRGFGCPPVWGYLGINQFVDICHIVQKHDSNHINNRLANSLKTKLPLRINTREPELRWFAYMAFNKNPYTLAFERKAVVQYQTGCQEDFQKCRAICDLLKLWYAPEVGDEIISLGIDSDGTFGIPEGLVFSQPVHLKVLEDDSRVWVPSTEFPMPEIPSTMFKNLIDTAITLRDQFITFRFTNESRL